MREIISVPKDRTQMKLERSFKMKNGLVPNCFFVGQF